METCPGSLQLHQFHPVPVPVCSCGPTVPPTQLRWPYQPYHSQDQGRDLSNGDQRWLGFCKRNRPHFFAQKKEPSHCHHWKHKSVPWTSEKKSRPAMSDLVKSTWWTIEWYCESCDDGHNFHPLQCYTDMKVCLHMSRSHKSYEASADIAPRRPALLGRSPWKIQSPAFAESRSKKTRASKTGCQKTF